MFHPPESETNFTLRIPPNQSAPPARSWTHWGVLPRRRRVGLVRIEASACGTPVVAFANGAVPEVLEEEVTGFIVHSEDQAVEAVRGISTLSQAR
jgi:glycosyltransferase involved in cell wall biosynthesis